MYLLLGILGFEALPTAIVLLAGSIAALPRHPTHSLQVIVSVCPAIQPQIAHESRLSLKKNSVHNILHRMTHEPSQYSAESSSKFSAP